jgi:glycosyltransferase involved in cell wall biosynthesis
MIFSVKQFVMNKLLFITYFWPPSGKATLHWPLKIIKHLPEFNWQPSILTVEQNKLSTKDDSLIKEIPENLKIYKAKSVEPFEIYKKFTGKNKNESLAESEFVSSENQSLANRISIWIRFNFFIPDARVGWYFSAVPTGKKILSKEKVDIIVSLGPPHSTHLVGYRLSKIFKIPFVPVLIDPWVDIVYYKTANRSKIAKRFDTYLERKILNHASKVVFVTKSTQEDYIKKYSFLKEKSYVLYWGYNEDDFQKIPDIKKEGDEEIITHAGNIFDYQNPKEFWKYIRKEIDNGRKLKLKFIGTVSPLIKKEIEKNSLNAFTDYVGFLPYHKMLEELKKSDYLLVCATEKRHVPGKLFEYLRAGKPIIAFGNDNEEVKNIIAEAKAGMIFKYDESGKESFEKAGSFKTDQNIVRKYDRKLITEKFGEILDEIKRV